MRAVGLKLLKNKLSEYVRLASQGETILISDRDRIVAEIVPPREFRSPLVSDAVLASFIRSGQLTPAIFPPASVPNTTPVARLDDILRGLFEDRNR